MTKLPRKLKKNLKSSILAGIDPTWRSKELKIKKYNREKGRVTSYDLG